MITKLLRGDGTIDGPNSNLDRLSDTLAKVALRGSDYIRKLASGDGKRKDGSGDGKMKDGCGDGK